MPDGEGTLERSGSDARQLSGKSWIEHLVDSPNGTPMVAELADTESVEITVAVPDGETLKVYRWGVYRVPTGDAPAGLQVQLLDGADTVQASANTTDNESTDSASPVASHTNASGSESIFKLRLDNATGSTEDVGGHFAYVVE